MKKQQPAKVIHVRLTLKCRPKKGDVAGAILHATGQQQSVPFCNDVSIVVLIAARSNVEHIQPQKKQPELGMDPCILQQKCIN